MSSIVVGSNPCRSNRANAMCSSSARDVTRLRPARLAGAGTTAPGTVITVLECPGPALARSPDRRACHGQPRYAMGRTTANPLLLRGTRCRYYLHYVPLLVQGGRHDPAGGNPSNTR